MAMDRAVFRPLRTQSPAVMLVATFAVAFQALINIAVTTRPDSIVFMDISLNLDSVELLRETVAVRHGAALR